MQSILNIIPVKVQRKFAQRYQKFARFPASHKIRSLDLQFESLSLKERKKWIFERVFSIACYAQKHNNFYRSFYKKNNFNANLMNEYRDLLEIPIVSKSILKQNINDWLQPGMKDSIGNTGGTSGQPLNFCVSKVQIAREYYFMNKVWNRIGCQRKHNRVVFRGVNIGEHPCKYIQTADAYFINLYLPFSKTSNALKELFTSHRMKYLHGYPSAIYQFAKFCLHEDNELLDIVNENLIGILYGSEYPAPQYRDVIEIAFPVSSISWYGHSEMVVLAAENGIQFQYEPFHAYGYCEALDMGDNETHLVGTCYDNYSSPFIRYDIEDSIKSVSEDKDLLTAFQIDKGRLGEFIQDKNNNPVSLTAMIFGRHHKAFHKFEFVQVSQSKPGSATLHITTKSIFENKNISSLFNLDNIDIEFDFILHQQPIRTRMGKVPLIVTEEMLKLSPSK